MAESLIDYSNTIDSNKAKEKNNSTRKGGRGQIYTQCKKSSNAQGSSNPRYDHNKSKSSKSGSNKCFLCDGPYFMKDYPTRNVINAMSALIDKTQADGNKISKDGALWDLYSS